MKKKKLYPLKKIVSNLHSKKKQLCYNPKKNPFLVPDDFVQGTFSANKICHYFIKIKSLTDTDGRTDGRQSLGNSSFFHNIIGNALKIDNNSIINKNNITFIFKLSRNLFSYSMVDCLRPVSESDSDPPTSSYSEEEAPNSSRLRFSNSFLRVCFYAMYSWCTFWKSYCSGELIITWGSIWMLCMNST